MTVIISASQISGRFRPVNWKHFSTYAKNLSRLTGDSHSGSLNTLARIYRYTSLYELQQELKQDGIPGPFDDDIPTEDFDADDVRFALEDRIVRVQDLILEASSERFLAGAPSPTLSQLCTLQLFGGMEIHKDGFRELAIPPTTSAERRAARLQFLGEQ